MARVLLEHVTKQFPDGTLAVDHVGLDIGDREFLVLVGPSGCGKSTTLRLIAGLERSTSGSVTIGERDVTNVAPKDRDIAMVFQNYALYPHMSVYKNMSFGLTLRQFGGVFGDGVIGRGLRKVFQPKRAAEFTRLRAEIDDKVRQTATRLGIQHLLDRKPHQLSGGERQRVALGRAIVRNPAAFLFDEPLSNLDAKLRQQMRVELRRLHRELQATMIYVTHDQVEAMTLGDRVAVMNGGKILQVGKPLEVYQRPANLFVAKFIGNQPINLCSGTVTQVGDAIRFQGAIDVELTTDQATLERVLSGKNGRSVVLGFRAEDIRLSDSDEHGSFDATVVETDRLGESTTIHCTVGSQPKSLSELGEENTKQVQSPILVRLEPNTSLDVGDTVQLVIKAERVHWFDSETGDNLLKD